MARFALGLFFLANGVFCEVNDVRLFAKNEAQCVEAGGVVTHTVTTTVEPADKASDNPDKEPETQRSKDKEPEAP